MSNSPGKSAANGSLRTLRLGRSMVTGQFILRPVEKKGSGADFARVRDATRTVIRNSRD